MKAFWAYSRQSFKNNSVYRINYLLGLVSACLQIYIMCSIWKALYGQNNIVAGVSYRMIVTNYIISIGLSNTFLFDDFAVQRKVSDGTISMELIRPIDYRISLLAGDLGNVLFYLSMKFCPVFIFTLIFVDIEVPQNIIILFQFLLSVFLGFLVLWGINIIVQMSTFWFVNIWSISVLKDLFITIFSGIALPLWFMPAKLLVFINYSPFSAIYFDPIKIYFGQMTQNEILSSYCKQIIWALIFFSLGNLMWCRGRKRLVIQGG